MSKVIKLTKDYEAIVDDVDFEELSKHKWHICQAANDVYACRDSGPHNNRHRVYMHRQITQCPHGNQIHHRNHNTLDNTRANLEVCSQTQNLSYRRK